MKAPTPDREKVLAARVARKATHAALVSLIRKEIQQRLPEIDQASVEGLIGDVRAVQRDRAPAFVLEHVLELLGVTHPLLADIRPSDPKCKAVLRAAIQDESD